MRMFWIAARVFVGASYSCSLCLRSASASSELRSMEGLSQLSITHVMEVEGASLPRERREGGGMGWRSGGRRETTKTDGMIE